MGNIPPPPAPLQTVDLLTCALFSRCQSKKAASATSAVGSADGPTKAFCEEGRGSAQFAVHYSLVVRRYGPLLLVFFATPFCHRTHQIQSEWGGVARDGTTEPVSRGQILRRERRQGKQKHFFPVQLSTSRIGSHTPVESADDIYIYICTHTPYFLARPYK